MSQITGKTLSRNVAPSEALASEQAAPSRRQDLVSLCKPRIAKLVLITTLIGAWMALPTQGARPWLSVLASVVGAALACMGASVFNQVIEAETDGLMRRTAKRPLPSGRVRPREAVLLGVLLTTAGIGVMLPLGLWLAALLTLVTVLLYALVYTPMKRYSSWALWVGAVPGAAPPLIGYAAVAGELALPAWLLFAIMFVWQIPHFLAIAWLYREDYARAGHRMLPVLDPSGRSTFRQAVWTCALLLPVGMLPTWLDVAGWWVFAGATLCGTGFLCCAVWLKVSPTAGRARLLFFASLIYLPVVLALIPMDRA